LQHFLLYQYYEGAGCDHYNFNQLDKGAQAKRGVEHQIYLSGDNAYKASSVEINVNICSEVLLLEIDEPK